jgi:hypothetical protein
MVVRSARPAQVGWGGPKKYRTLERVEYEKSIFVSVHLLLHIGAGLLVKNAVHNEAFRRRHIDQDFGGRPQLATAPCQPPSQQLFSKEDGELALASACKSHVERGDAYPVTLEEARGRCGLCEASPPREAVAVDNICARNSVRFGRDRLGKVASEQDDTSKTLRRLGTPEGTCLASPRRLSPLSRRHHQAQECQSCAPSWPLMQ